jgi:hypothetical protein
MNIKRNKIPKKTRLFSSKPRSLSYKQLPIQARPKTGITRDINNSLDDSTTLASKGKLRDIQKEINELQESGVEVSQYDLDVLRKKYEMAIAYEQWQDAQNAKTVVRMQRDNEGNYGYVYTAD